MFRPISIFSVNRIEHVHLIVTIGYTSFLISGISSSPKHFTTCPTAIVLSSGVLSSGCKLTSLPNWLLGELSRLKIKTPSNSIKWSAKLHRIPQIVNGFLLFKANPRHPLKHIHLPEFILNITLQHTRQDEKPNALSSCKTSK